MSLLFVLACFPLKFIIVVFLKNVTTEFSFEFFLCVVLAR